MYSVIIGNWYDLSDLSSERTLRRWFESWREWVKDSWVHFRPPLDPPWSTCWETNNHRQKNGFYKSNTIFKAWNQFEPSLWISALLSQALGVRISFFCLSCSKYWDSIIHLQATVLDSGRTVFICLDSFPRHRKEVHNKSRGWPPGKCTFIYRYIHAKLTSHQGEVEPQRK